MKKSISIGALIALSFASANGIPQGKNIKPPVLQGPKRTVIVDSVDVKCSSVTNGTGPGGFGINLGVSSGNSSASGGATTPTSLPLSDPASFASGLCEIMTTALGQSKAFIVIERPKAPVSGSAGSSGEAVAPPEVSAVTTKVQFLIRATVTDLTVRTKSAGFNVSALGLHREEFTNKVVIDVRLIDPETNQVLETVKATGQKSSKSNLLGLYDGSTKLFGYEEFAESPLGEATRLALEDSVTKLIAKLSKYPWQAVILDVLEEKGQDAIYLNVGSESGLKVGEVLEVVREGKELKDPANGRSLGRTRATILGRVEIVSIEGESVIAKPLDGLKAEAGLIVRLLKK